jgi:hypothetical protein
LPVDAPCVEDPDCASGYCSTLSETCQRRGDLGEACSANTHCESGNCTPDALVCGESIPEACQ